MAETKDAGATPCQERCGSGHLPMTARELARQIRIEAENDAKGFTLSRPEQFETYVEIVIGRAIADACAASKPPRQMTDDDLLGAAEDLSSLDRAGLERLVRLLTDMVLPHSAGVVCGARDPFSPRRCALPPGHSGPHRDTGVREAELARVGKEPRR